MTLKAPKPKSLKYPRELKTLGDHIRKRRLDLNLFQKQVAAQIGVSEATIYNWERNTTSPQVRDLPAIMRFLGYNPLAGANDSSRKAGGAPHEDGAEPIGVGQLGIDSTTVERLEQE